MKSDEGIQLHLFDMDKYADTIDEDHVIFVAKMKSHMEYTSIPFHGNLDAKYCIAELGGYGGMAEHKWIVLKIVSRKTAGQAEIFDSMTEAIIYVESLTGKIVQFRQEG